MPVAYSMLIIAIPLNLKDPVPLNLNDLCVGFCSFRQVLIITFLVETYHFRSGPNLRRAALHAKKLHVKI